MANKNIKMKLSLKSINDLIQKLQETENDINLAKMSIVQELVDGAVKVIIENTPVDTGDTVSSTTSKVGINKATITQTGTHVIFNEYGTGPIGAAQPHPEKIDGWAYSSEGWEFYNFNKNSKWYGKRFTMGQPAHAQMYKGAKYIKDNMREVASKKVREILSKI